MGGQVPRGRERICFLAAASEEARIAVDRLASRYGNIPAEECHVIVALGGDGFMLQTLHDTRELGCPVYGMNRGSIGFLMNSYDTDNLRSRLEAAEEEIVNPLSMDAVDLSGRHHKALAINEVSLFRACPQVIKLRIFVDGRSRLDELVCDGALVCTPAGSTAYNYSAHGPILPLGSDVLALTAMAAFRPRRWRGALLPKSASVKFEVLEPEKRPCMADADGRSATRVREVSVAIEPSIKHRILFDPGLGLQERLLREQFE
ncbi:MAG: NAD kinase [Rhodobacteraceae bacterium]|nr:NAD kinase [Paracoccaceae bacterium]